MNDSTELKIDVDGVIRARLPRYYRFIPRFIIRWMEKTICQERMNELLRGNRGATGAEFCRGVLADLNVSVDVQGEENLPSPDNRRVLFVCNHPLGGLDGIALIDYVERRYGVAPKFIVNDLLMSVTPLRDIFVPINKHGAQSREYAREIDRTFESDLPVIIFPAGLVSRRQKKGRIEDLTWQKMFVNKARQYRRDVIPMFFCGENSPFFYKFAKFRKRLGLKFNIEMIYLPREVFRSENKHFTVIVDKPVSWTEFAVGTARQWADRIRQRVYSLKPLLNQG